VGYRCRWYCLGSRDGGGVERETRAPPGSGFAASHYSLAYDITEFIETANIANYGGVGH
jgi:hypothetical protein